MNKEFENNGRALTFRPFEKINDDGAAKNIGLKYEQRETGEGMSKIKNSW